MSDCSFTQGIFLVSTEGVYLQCCLVVTWLVPRKTVAMSVHVLRAPYNHAPVSQCHFIQSHIHKMDLCLAVTCHLHFWQNGQDLSNATAVIKGVSTNTEIRIIAKN